MAAGRAKIRKDDTVAVTIGKERGKTGKVLRVYPDKGRAIVEKLNFQKRHVRKGHPMAQQGGVIEREAPIPLTNLRLICPKCQEKMRPRFQALESGTRVRVCRKCGEQIG
jgi:large subunit ribosomal protein L24